MEFIDTHTHIYLEQFKEDRDQMVKRALDREVHSMLLPNIDRNTIEAMNHLAQLYPNNLHPMMGLHPCSVKAPDLQADLEWMRNELESGKYIAVGETGIDLYWDKSSIKEQTESFRNHVKWSIELDLPLVIHARESFTEIFELIDEMNDDRLKGVFHCFTGGREEANKILSFGGFKMGLGGVLTYKNSGLKETVAQYDLEHFVLETDAPYLSPVPYRGKRNEPSYIPFIAEHLAGAMGEKIEVIARVTTENAKELFKLN